MWLAHRELMRSVVYHCGVGGLARKSAVKLNETEPVSATFCVERTSPAIQCRRASWHRPLCTSTAFNAEALASASMTCGTTVCSDDASFTGAVVIRLSSLRHQRVLADWILDWKRLRASSSTCSLSLF